MDNTFILILQIRKLTFVSEMICPRQIVDDKVVLKPRSFAAKFYMNFFTFFVN